MSPGRSCRRPRSRAGPRPGPGSRLVPNPAKKAAARQVRHAEILAAAAQAQRDASLAALRNPAPGQPVTITNQMISALDAPVEAAYRELDEADTAAAATPSRVPLGTLAPDMMRLEAEIKQITHAIRMTAYNAETTLARTLNGYYARAGDEAWGKAVPGVRTERPRHIGADRCHPSRMSSSRGL